MVKARDSRVSVRVSVAVRSCGGRTVISCSHTPRSHRQTRYVLMFSIEKFANIRVCIELYCNMLTIYTFRDLRLWICCGDINSSAHEAYWGTAEGDFALLCVSNAYWTNGSSACVHSCFCSCLRADRVGAHERSAQTIERDVFENISRGESIAI